MTARKIKPVGAKELRGQRQESLEGPWRVDGKRPVTRPRSRAEWFVVYTPTQQQIAGPLYDQWEALRLCAQFNALAAERKRGTRA